MNFLIKISPIYPQAISRVFVFGTLVLLCACGKHSEGHPPHYTSSGTNQSQPNVILTPSQLNAIKINAAVTYLFRNEIDATGSVNFAEDPAIFQAESTLLSAAATYNTAQKEFVRAQALFPTKGVSQRELEQASSDQQTAKATLAAAQNALGVLGKTVSQINRIMVAGRIPTSEAGHSGFKWVLANINESDAPSVRQGQAVRVEIYAVPGREYLGKVAEIYSVVDPNLHRESVRLEVKDADGELRSGMLADVHIAIKQSTDAVSIPDSGVVREGDGTMTAWVTADRRKFVQRRIEVASSQDGRTQILKGLRSGELVVTDGAVLLDNILQMPVGDQ